MDRGPKNPSLEKSQPGKDRPRLKTAIATITRPTYSGSRFRTQLQRPVHLLKATSSIPIQHFPEKRQQQTFESLPLDKPHTTLNQRFDRERMFAVEQSRQQEMT